MKKYLLLFLLCLPLSIGAAENGKQKPLTQEEQKKLNDALMVALSGKKPQVKEVRSLLEARANHIFGKLRGPGEEPNFDDQPLSMAARNHSFEHIPLLIEHQRKIDASLLETYVNQCGYRSQFPLSIACEIYKRYSSDKNLAVVKLLLDAKANPNRLIVAHLVNRHPYITPLIYLFAYDPYKWNDPSDPHFLKLLELLVKHPMTNVNQPDFNFWEDRGIGGFEERDASRIRHNKTLLMYVAERASQEKDLKQQQELAPKKGFFQKFKAKQKIENPYLPAIELLLRFAADPGIKDYKDKTALDYIPNLTVSARPIRELLKGKMHHPAIVQATGLHPNLVKIITGYVTGFDVFEETEPK